jgi:predicted AlkP superfamily phosphohydrolase/phosphomutase
MPLSQSPNPPSESPTSSPRKVLLVGWDAADWKVIHPLLDAGKMPHLARFLEQGVMGNIATLQPALSPTLWTSIATGKRPYKHGILGFSEPDPVTGGIRPITNLSRKTKAIWNILNQEGKNTITVGWWPSNPAEPLSKGVMVSNDYQQAHGSAYEPEKWPLKPETIHPERLIRHLKDLRFHPAELTEDDLRPFLPGLDGMSREDLDKAEKDPRIQSLAKIIADCTSIHSAATALIQNEPWDLMCVYYDAIDHFGHAFMKYHPPQRPQVNDWDFKVFNQCVESGYIYHDAMLGCLLDLAGEDTTVILMSDHGFHPDDMRLSNIPREPAGPAAEHRQFGIFAAKGPGIRQDGRVFGASLIDICPTLLHLFGLPVGEDMDGKVLLDIYENPPTDIQRIPSWDAVAGDHGMHPPDKQISAADSKAALEQLVALGYIEEPDADQSKAIEQTVRELDYNLAQAWIDGGFYIQAVTLLERLYQKWPMEHRFGFKLATCYQSQGRPAELRTLVTTVSERRMQEASEAIATLKELKLDDEEVQKAEKERIEAMTDPEKEKFGRERRELLAQARATWKPVPTWRKNAMRTPSPSSSSWTATSAHAAMRSPCAASCCSGSSVGTSPAPPSKKRSPWTRKHPGRCSAWPAPRWPRGITRPPSATPAPRSGCSTSSRRATTSSAWPTTASASWRRPRTPSSPASPRHPCSPPASGCSARSPASSTTPSARARMPCA